MSQVLRWAISLPACCAFVFLCLVKPADCGELVQRNYNLSGDGGPEPQQQKRAVSESVFKEFEKDVKGISPEKRKELIKTFTQQRDDALKDGRGDESVYYNRLLEILKKY